jgi:hypothetical protein
MRGRGMSEITMSPRTYERQGAQVMALAMSAFLVAIFTLYAFAL